VEVVFSANVGKFDCGLDHALWGIAPKGHNASREGAMVGADADRSVLLFAFQYKRSKKLFDCGNVGIILLPAIINSVLEAFDAIGKISRIYAYLFKCVGNAHCNRRRKVYIGDERDIKAFFEQRFPNLHASICFEATLDRETGKLSTFFSNFDNLLGWCEDGNAIYF